MIKRPSVNYDKPMLNCNKSLFDFWEEGEFPFRMSTPAVAVLAYRKWLLSLFFEYSNSSIDNIISLGSGNGFIELELNNANYIVLATDNNNHSIEIIRNKGLNATHFDVISDDHSKLGKAAIIYADGLMGHIWDDRHGYKKFFTKLYKMLLDRGRVIVSNDLCDIGMEDGSQSVDADPSAFFYRSLPGYVASQAIDTGLFIVLHEATFVYDRPGRGLRRREVVIFRMIS